MSSNYSKEKVLEWVNSAEARAAKYEQEAKVKQTKTFLQTLHTIHVNKLTNDTFT